MATAGTKSFIPPAPSVGVMAVAQALPADASVEEKKVDDNLNNKKISASSSEAFMHHEKVQLPPAPRGTEWVLQPNNRWTIQPIAQAEVTIVADGSFEVDSDETATAATPAATILEHWIQPSDTFSGLCLKYGVSATQLRRANYGFSGTNLSLAPNPLKIPNIRRAVPEVKDREQLQRTLEFIFRQQEADENNEPVLSQSEIKCYLELNDWDIHAALQNALDDLEEREVSVDPAGEKARFDIVVEKVVIDEEL